LKDFCDILSEVKHRRGEQFALATIVRTQGSSYRRPGARMLICEDGKTVGSLSASCLEQEIASRALEVLKTGEPAIMRFDTRKRFGCAGEIEIFVEPAPENFFLTLADNLHARFTCLAITRFSGEALGTRIAQAMGTRWVFPRSLPVLFLKNCFHSATRQAPNRLFAKS
jgi:xanthine/CO dehydrogenase XdhC/CoxF family maturation factor